MFLAVFSMDNCLSYELIYSQINQREEGKRHHQLMMLGASRMSILGLLGHLAIGMSLKALGVLLLYRSTSRSCDSHSRYLVVGQ